MCRPYAVIDFAQCESFDGFVFDYLNKLLNPELLDIDSDDYIKPILREGDVLWSCGVARDVRHIWDLLPLPRMTPPFIYP